MGRARPGRFRGAAAFSAASGSCPRSGRLQAGVFAFEGNGRAESLGIGDFHMMPALNDSPLLIRALADLVLRAVGRRSGVASLAI